MKEQPVKERMYAIDVLRAIATVLIIVTHVFQYHLGGFFNTFVWNYAHFAVVLFVFCSVSVLLPSVERMEMNVANLFAWCKKRFWRLIKPFYSYLFAHAILILLLPSIFNGNGLKLTPEFLIDSITLTGGINFNWLVLLFIEIALVFPLIYKVSQRRSWSITWGIASFCFIVATLFLPELHSSYRLIMIIGWSLVVLLSILVVQSKIKAFHVFLGALTVFSFLLLMPDSFLRSSSLSTRLIDHKYPPDIYYLSYATMMSMAIYFLGKAKFWEQTWLKEAISFISKHSYEIFFIHYIVLDASLRLSLGVWNQLLFVFAITMTSTYLIDVTPRFLASLGMTMHSE